VRRSEDVGLRLAGRRAAERMTGTTYWLETLLPKYPARFAGIPTTSACRQGCTLHEPELSTENVGNYTSCPSPTLVPILDCLPQPRRTANKTRTLLRLKVRFRPKAVLADNRCEMGIYACCIVEQMKNCRNISTILPIDVIAGNPIQLEFEAVVADAIKSISVALGSLLNSLYLYGSVARGCAVPRKSDLDLTVVLTRQASGQERTLLEELRLDLEASHNEIVKVDFDVGVLADVLNRANLFSWGYWLKHECRCIYGDDLSQHFEAFMPSRKIAEAVNRSYGETLNDYASRIACAVDLITAKRLQKEAARKLVRSTNVLRPTVYPFWPRTLDDYFFDFSKWYPSLAPDLEFFLIQAREPDTSVTEFNARLSRFLSWMLLEQQRLSRSA